jgi:hypothetical protein
MQMHRVPELEINRSKVRFTLYAPLVLAVYSVTMCYILITVYVQPYQETTGTLAAGGSVNWLSGESLLVLAGPVVVLPTALIAWRMIRKSYG